MLKEKIFFREGLPVNTIIANIVEYPIHFHDEMEVVYVLRGSVKLKNGYYNYLLKAGDIFILNDREIHSFETSGEPNMVLMLQIDLKFFSKYYNNLKNCFFVTDMKDADDESLEMLRTLLARIVLETIAEEKDFEHRAIEHTSNLLSCLINDFQYFAMEEGKFVNEAKNKGNKVLAERLNRISDYMYDNHARKLTLNEIAEMEHLSIFYLSHVIKAATGLSFQDLLSFIRVEESEKLLLGTDKKIGTIALESGFSAVRYYVKYFEKWFGMHPSDYRKAYTGKVSSRETKAVMEHHEPEEIINVLKQQIKDIYSVFDRELKPDVQILNLDLKNSGPVKAYKEIAFRFTPKCSMETAAKYGDQIIEACRDLDIREIDIRSMPEDVSFSAIEKMAAAGLRLSVGISGPGASKGEIISRLKQDGLNKIKSKYEGRTGISIHAAESEPADEKTNYMWDSLIMMPYIFKKFMENKGAMKGMSTIVDDTNELVEIKGKPGIMTAGLIRKPSYYAYKMLSDLRGGIISAGSNHIISAVSRSKENCDGLRILLYNDDERVGRMVEGQYPLAEVMEAVYKFRNSLEVVLKISGLAGAYKVKRYKYSRENSMLAFNAKLGFPGSLTTAEEQMCQWGSSPDVDFSVINVTDIFNLQSYLSGFSAELIMLDRLE